MPVLAGRLHLLPPRVELHLVQVGSLHHGSPLSPAVEAAAQELVRSIDASLDTVDAA